MYIIGDEPPKPTQRVNKIAKVMIASVLIIIVSSIGYCSYHSSIINEPMYILNNLDEKAVHKNDFKIPKDRHVRIRYQDTDFDNGYDSYLQWENSSTEMKKIPIAYNKKGQYVFSKLDINAIRPDDALHKGILVDYVDTNNDGKFESIVRE